MQLKRFTLKKKIFRESSNCMKIFLGQKNNGKPLSEYYASLKGMWEEWNAYQPLLVDIKVPRKQMGRVLGC